MIRKTGLYTFFGYTFIACGVYVLVSALYKLSRVDSSSYANAILVHVLESQIIGAISTIFIGGLILGLASVIKQNNETISRFEVLNKKLDILLQQTIATESLDDTPLDFDATDAYPDFHRDGVSNWDLWRKKTHFKLSNTEWLIIAAVVAMIIIVVANIVR